MRTYRKLIFVFCIAFALLNFTANNARFAEAQQALKYGDSVEGTIATPNDVLSYTFTGQKGDAISITAVRKTGDLNPQIGLTETVSGNILTQGTPMGDGSIAMLTTTLPTAESYTIYIASDPQNGGTGKFQLVLTGPAKSSGGGVTATPNAKTTPSTKATPKPGKLPTGAVKSFTVGASPVYSLWNGSNIYVANYSDGTVSELDSDGNLVNTLQVGGTPFNLAWDGKRLWVADLGADGQTGQTVFVFDATGKKVASYKVGLEPFSLSYDKDNNRMWIALYGENKVLAVDMNGKVLTTVTIDNRPNTVLWDGTQLWVTIAGDNSNQGTEVIAIDTDGTILGTYQVGGSPADLAWDKDGQALYVANSDTNNVSVLDATGNPIGKFKVGQAPAALAWDGSHLWISLSGADSVVAVDKTGKILVTVPANNPNGIMFDGTYIWVCNEGLTAKPSKSITRIDVAAVLGAN